MTTGPIPLCDRCRHLDLDASEEKGKIVCKAFPDGIPTKFWHGEVEHRTPEPGDHGIQFEPLPDHG